MVILLTLQGGAKIATISWKDALVATALLSVTSANLVLSTQKESVGGLE